MNIVYIVYGDDESADGRNDARPSLAHWTLMMDSTKWPLPTHYQTLTWLLLAEQIRNQNYIYFIPARAVLIVLMISLSSQTDPVGHSLVRSLTGQFESVRAASTFI